MNNMKNNRVRGLVFIVMLSFFLIGVQWTAAEAVEVTINGPEANVTITHKLAPTGLNISDDGSISLSVLSKVYNGEIKGNVDYRGSVVYLQPAGVATGAAKYAPIDPQTGNYSFTNLPYGSYIVFPLLEGAKFTPANKLITLDATTPSVSKADFVGGAAVSATYAIYGTVSGASGSVTLNVSGATKTISAPGSYIFSGLEPGDYTLTATSTDLNITPQGSQTAKIIGSDVKFDFTASMKTYKISGHVKEGNAAIAGAVISINTGTCSNTDSSGYYTCNNLANGSYTVSASKSGYSITPASANVNISNADKTQDFTAATATTYTISGSVTGLTAGDIATINLSGTATQSTTTNGAYSFTGLLAGNYTVTPSKTGYNFTPTSSGSFSLSSDIVKNFTATPIGGGGGNGNVKVLGSAQELLRNDLPVGMSDLYKGVVPVKGLAAFVNATKDWVTRRDMLVMYGGAACDQRAPDINDHKAIMAGISNGSMPSRTDAGVLVNGRTFYYDFSNVMNQSVKIGGRVSSPPASEGCYLILIYNVSTDLSDYSLTFTTVPR